MIVDYGYKLLEVQQRIDRQQDQIAAEKLEKGQKDNDRRRIEKIQDKAHGLISVKRTATDGRLFANFEAIFSVEPLPADISYAQSKAGYAPQGYGGPYQIKIDVGYGEHANRWKATWHCSGNCD